MLRFCLLRFIGNFSKSINIILERGVALVMLTIMVNIINWFSYEIFEVVDSCFQLKGMLNNFS